MLLKKNLLWIIIIIFPLDIYLPISNQGMLLSYPFMFALSVLTLIDILKSRDTIRLPGIVPPLILLFPFILLSSYNTQQLGWLVTKTVHFYLMFFFFLAVIRSLNSHDEFISFLRWLVISCVILALIGIYQWIAIMVFRNQDILQLTYNYYYTGFGDAIDTELSRGNLLKTALFKGLLFRSTSLFTTPGEFAFFLFTGTIILLYFKKEVKFSPFAHSIFMVLFIFANLLCFTRIIWVITILSFLIFSFQSANIKRMVSVFAVMAAIIFSISILVNSVGLGPVVKDLVVTLGQKEDDASTELRFNTFLEGIDIATENPFGDGWGAHNNDMHSFYERHMAEVGFGGAAILLWFLLVPLYDASIAVRRQRREIKQAGLFGINYFICLLVMFTSQGALFRSKQAYLIWFFIAAMHLTKCGFETKFSRAEVVS